MKIINKTILKSGIDIAKSTKAKVIFLFIDALDEWILPEKLPKGCEIVLITQKPEELDEFESTIKKIISIPKINLGRTGLIKLSLALALSQQLVTDGDRVVFVFGTTELMLLDTILLIEIGKEAELITSKNLSGLSETVKPEVFEHLLSLTVELANKGREGKPIGTIFVLGDQDRVMQLSKQMIINPFKGYEESERNILNPGLKETIREFAALDGAFIVGDDGTLITAGRYLGAAYDEDDVPRGLGSRHIAAAGITALTNAIAIVISESTGDLRIFKNGKIVMEIEKP
ncbi:MAG: diadenylate cyclase [bacterium]